MRNKATQNLCCINTFNSVLFVSGFVVLSGAYCFRLQCSFHENKIQVGPPQIRNK